MFDPSVTWACRPGQKTWRSHDGKQVAGIMLLRAISEEISHRKNLLVQMEKAAADKPRDPAIRTALQGARFDYRWLLSSGRYSLSGFEILDRDITEARAEAWMREPKSLEAFLELYRFGKVVKHDEDVEKGWTREFCDGAGER